MIFGQDRQQLRQMYRDAWQRRCDDRPLSALDAQIAAVIELHPEYTDAVTGEALDRDYTPEGGETNPFLHMSLHLGLREQIATDRPKGIREIFAQLSARTGDAHDTEHHMIDCLAETLWEAQSRGGPPDEQTYLRRLRKLTR